ncbi:MAG: thioredoxin family protein [Patescibacteria group bacterium]
MKQAKWLISFLLLAGLIVGGVLFFNKDEVSEDSDVAKTEVVESENSNPVSTDTGDETAVAPAGKYVDYSEGLLTNETIGTKVLFFYAPWCPQCRELDESIKAGEVPSGVTIIKVDYDSNQSLRSRYGVTIQTTLVQISGAGDLVKKYVAYDDPSLKSLIENAL